MSEASVTKKSGHDAAYWTLRKALQDGAFAPGQKLTNRQLADAIGVSVTPVREAIRRLISEGALSDLPNGSVAVPSISIAQFVEEIGWMMLTLESRAVALAAPRMGAADIVRLESLFEQARSACEGDDFVRANTRFREFYFTIFERADQPVLLGVLDKLWLRIGSLHRIVLPGFVKAEQGRHYREMIEALRRADATKAVLALSGFHSRLERHLEALEEAAPKIVARR